MEINLLIADDHRLFRESLANLLVNNSIHVIAQASNGKEAIEKTGELEPDIVLMDIGMEGMDGITATKVIKEEFPEVKIIGLSMYADKNYIKGMLEAGAHGYLLKNCTYAQLKEAIHTVYRGNKYLTDEVTKIVVDDLLLDKGHEKNFQEVLTKRELEVLKLYAEGYSTREIAEKLFVSSKTVATHKQHILKKINLKSVADMMKFSLKSGLIPLI